MQKPLSRKNTTENHLKGNKPKQRILRKMLRRAKEAFVSLALIGTVVISSCTFDSRGMAVGDSSIKDGKADVISLDAKNDLGLFDVGEKDAIDSEITDAFSDTLKPDTVPQWWNTNWKYCREINVTGNPPADFSNSVLLVSTNFDYSHANSDLSDLRFLEGTCKNPDVAKGILGAWIDEVNPTKGSAVWFRTKSANIANVAMFYGNSVAANIFSGNSTFDFFDGFEGTALDGTKWGNYSGESLNGGILTLTTNGSGIYAYARSLKTYGSNTAVESRAKLGKTTWALPQEGLSLRVSYQNTTSKIVYMIDDGLNLIHGYVDSKGIGSYDFNLTANALLNDSYHTWGIIRTGTDTNFLIDGTQILSSNSVFSDLAYIKLGFFGPDDESGTGTLNISYDWIRIRKFITPEPTYFIGKEEKP